MNQPGLPAPDDREEGDVALFIGSVRASEDGGLEAQAANRPDEWLWTDSPATNKP